MSKAQAAPPGLGDAGRKLWRSITGTWELDGRELAVLSAAARQADDVAKLEAQLEQDGLTVLGSAGQPRLNAVVTELRQSRLAVGRLLDQLQLPGDEQRISRRAQRAAQRRWGA